MNFCSSDGADVMCYVLCACEHHVASLEGVD